MKIALVHDMLTQNGGAERVLQAFHEIWPEAPIYTLIYNQKKAGKFFKEQEIKTSFLQKIPGSKNKYQWYLILMPQATESFDLSQYDLVLSSASALIKGVRVKSPSLHICYCHTPTRYLWSDAGSYLEHLPYSRIVKSILPPVLNHIRSWDYQAARKVDQFIANSQTVQGRIKKYYQRDSEIIYPPVDVNNFYLTSGVAKKYFLIGGRLVAYKKYDLAVKAFSKLNLPLKVFGVGPELKLLKKLAGPRIEFLGEISDEKKKELFANAQAFINPQEEDFGITAVESLASGRPVIAYRAGGATEIIKEGMSGLFFEEQTWEALADSIIHFKSSDFNPLAIKQESLKFDTSIFKHKISDYLGKIFKNKV